MPRTKSSFKKLPKTLTICQNGEILPNLVTLASRETTAVAQRIELEFSLEMHKPQIKWRKFKEKNAQKDVEDKDRE